PRVAVGGGIDDERRADGAARAGLVLDDEGLPELVGKLLGHFPGGDIEGTARRPWHDDLHGLGRPLLREGLERGREQEAGNADRKPFHRVVSISGSGLATFRVTLRAGPTS